MKKLGCLLVVVIVCSCAGYSAAECAWVKTEKGPLNMRRQANSKSTIIARIPNGERIEVDEAETEWSHVSYAGKDGYVKTAYLRLATQMIGKAIYPDEDYLYVRKKADASAESVAVVRAAQPMMILGVEGVWARVSCCNEAYGKVYGYVNLDDISEQREILSDGKGTEFNVYVELSTDTMAIGDVADVFVRYEGEAAYQYRLYLDGEVIFEGEPVAHKTASYRPRKAGHYRLEVIAHDAEGSTVGCEAFFDVQTIGESKTRQAAAVFGKGQLNPKAYEIYSQLDGWWKDKKYGRKNLESSGCAIFTLSHALQLLGHAEEAARPDNLSERYGAYLVESGTLNGRLLASAANDFGFETYTKITNASDVIRWFNDGAVFSFLVAKGHVALAAGLSSDGSKVRIIDSAPGATLERIIDAKLYYANELGFFQTAQTLWDIPGTRYYFETDSFGALEYYLDLEYVAKRGVRLIAPKE